VGCRPNANPLPLDNLWEEVANLTRLARIGVPSETWRTMSHSKSMCKPCGCVAFDVTLASFWSHDFHLLRPSGGCNLVEGRAYTYVGILICREKGTVAKWCVSRLLTIFESNGRL
jgi:hypothetical protein